MAEDELRLGEARDVDARFEARACYAPSGPRVGSRGRALQRSSSRGPPGDTLGVFADPLPVAAAGRCLDALRDSRQWRIPSLADEFVAAPQCRALPKWRSAEGQVGFGGRPRLL